MQIFFHIGPHKTGTTSIQSYLLGSIGSVEPVDHWYPYTRASEPGHAEYARDWMWGEARMLRDLLDQAERARVSKLIVSAEDFDNLYNREQDVLRQLLGPFDVHLIITMNSLVSRAASSWQEAVKHGYPHTLDDAAELIFSMPGYRPDFVDVALQVVAPSRTTIIVASRDQPPAKLITDFCQTVGQPVQSKDRPIPNSNVRLYRNEAEQMRKINQIATETGLSRARAKEIRKAMLHDLLKARNPDFDYERIETPEAMKGPLRGLAYDIKSSIMTHMARGDVSVLGDLEELGSN